MERFASVSLRLSPSSHNLPSFLPKAHHSLIFLTKICRRLAAIFLLCSLSQTVFSIPGFSPSCTRIPDLVSFLPLYCPFQVWDITLGISTSVGSYCVCCLCCAAWSRFRAALEAHQNKDNEKILQNRRPRNYQNYYRDRSEPPE